jgi:hypothetical protein
MTTTFNYEPYYDDFDEDKNFLRILFQPGYSVQARELTQLQTILANQIEKFGNHIFKNGSPVIGGKVSLDDRANYITLQNQYNGIDIVPADFVGKTIISYNSTKQVRARVIDIDLTTTNPILIVKYLSGELFAEDDELKIFGQNIFAKLVSIEAVGRSYVASIQDGVYYFKGQFVKVNPQFLTLETFYRKGHNSTTIFKQPSYKIGIEFEEQIIDYIDDTSLLDPAQGAYNYQAPGANRFKVLTTLSKRTLDSSDTSSFFEIIRMVEGVKTKEIDYPIYSEIEKTLARRTYDESGNYTVDPFVLSLQEEFVANNVVVDDKFSVVLDPGKAYVGGFEFQTIAPTVIGVDRGRETVAITDYDLPTSVRSTVALKDVQGIIDITTFPKLDIHCVSTENVNVTTNAAYSSTIIGSLRVSSVDYNDSTDSANGRTHSLTTNVFEVNGLSITGTVASASSANTITLPAGFSNSTGNDAYANMFFRITDAGGASIAPIRIASSVGSTKTITLSQNLPFVPSSANTFSIDSDFKVAESVISRSGLSKVFAANIDSDSKDTLTGFAYINEPNGQALIFDLPFEALKEDSISDFDIFAKKLYSNRVSDPSGIITISTEGTDTFVFAGAGGNTVLNDGLILNNIICLTRFNTATNTSLGIVANTVLSLANNNFTVTAISPTTLSIDVKESGVRADFIINTKINNAENSSSGAIRGKQLLPLNDNVDLHAKVPFELDNIDTLEAANSSNKVAVANVGTVFVDIGATYFDNNIALTDLRTPGKTVSLQVPDVYEIVRITDSLSNFANVTTAMLTSASHDVTDNYEFDNGQRKTHYDHATLKLKRGYSSPRGRVYVQYRYLSHQPAPSPQIEGLFTVDSYLKTGSNFTYDDISVFNNKSDSKIVNLRSALDFRPTRTIGSDTITGAVNVDADGFLTLSAEHYLARIDQLVVKPSREFAIIKGKSAVKPIAPPVSEQDMLIYTLNIPAYTETVKDVRADFKNNRRFTMNDIGRFETRIKTLEYYVALNGLEKSAADSKILDANGLERSKYGILTDNFITTDTQATRSDVGFDNRNLIENSELKPASLMRTFKMNLNSSASVGAFKTVGVGEKKSLLLNYTSSELASQPYATKAVPIANALFANFKGSLKLVPEFSADVDTDITAQVVLNSFDGIENAFNFINEAFKFISDQEFATNPNWVNDKDNPFAKIVDEKWFETVRTVTNQTVRLARTVAGNQQTTTDRTFISAGAELYQKQISTSTSEVDVGSFVTDIAIQPYLKPQPIIFNANAMRPNTRMYSFFDDVDVNRFVIVPNSVRLNATSALLSTELCLVANTSAELAANLSSFNSGGNNFEVITITNSETGSANVSVVNGTGKPLANKVVYGLDSRRYFTISSVTDHRSGVTRAVTTNTITLASDAPSVNIAGNTISLVYETSSTDGGVGNQYTIIAYNTSTKVATISGSTSAANRTGSWIYSIGNIQSNKLGQASGIFIPPKAAFRSGERKFRLTESFNNTYDTEAVSYAEKTYIASGLKVEKTNLLNTVYNVDVEPQLVGTTTSAILQRTVSSTRITNTWRVDPLAQTFFVDDAVYPNGMFLESVDLFFRAKDDENIPVTVQIRPTVNGVPSSDFWYPESVVTKYPSEIVVSENPSLTAAATATNFTFESPVFLKPGLYAIVVLTDSPDASLWVAEKGATTTTNQFVATQPYLGTLYKSQNTMEYTPYINEDMMFRLNRCVFSTTPATFVLESQAQSRKFYMDKFRMLVTALSPLSETAMSTTYSFVSKPIDQSKETSYREFIPQVKYSFGDDDLYIVGSRRKELQARGDFTVQLTMSTNDNAVTPLISLESIFLNAWENFVDNASIETSDFNIIVPGSGYSNSNTITVNSTTGSGANVFLVVDGANGNVVGVNVVSGGAGYTDDFDITINSSTGANAVIVLNSEYDSSGGPCDARYITKPVTLADGFDAGDLRVFISANKMGNSEVEVFYKVLSALDDTEFKDRPYQKLVCVNPTTTPSKTDTEFREYEYRPSLIENQITYTSEDGVTYDTFKTFAIKIVMTSTDPAIVPKVKDLRVIALPAE